jgi:UDP-N-acetylmuramate--alanine ligase
MTGHKNHQIDVSLKPGSHIHFVGIGGFGLSAIGRVLLGKGFVVSGSDLEENQLTSELASAGATIYQGHRAENWQGANALLVSSAIPDSNPELVSAEEAGLPILKREDVLGNLMSDSYGIAVAGSHGKTTTTGMISQILIEAGLDPTIIVGGVLPIIGSNGHAGKGKHFVVEADEYDYMFLGLRPKMAVITNIEYDHPDVFPDADVYMRAFRRFARLIPEDGVLIVCADDTRAFRLGAEVSLPVDRVESYGFGEATWRAVDLRPNQLGGLDFLVQQDGESAGLARLRVPGEHNVLNALAAVAVASNLDIEFNAIRTALADFRGIGRRFQILGEIGGVTVVNDYAHHPTEIRATLAAARQQYPDRRIWAVWQPHTFSRIRSMRLEFETAFNNADRVVALDVFRSREIDTLDVDIKDVVAGMNHENASFLGDTHDASSYILDRLQAGDVVITLTAGDGYVVGEQVLKGIQIRFTNSNSANGKVKQESSDKDDARSRKQG